VPFLQAVNDLQIDVLGAMIVGMIGGLLLFSKIVSYLLSRWRAAILALLTGLLGGSLVRLWPWRASDTLMTPGGYGNATGEEAMVLGIILVALAGLGMALLLAKHGEQGR
jgi:putative membrane protein